MQTKYKASYSTENETAFKLYLLNKNNNITIIKIQPHLKCGRAIANFERHSRANKKKPTRHSRA